MCNGSKKNALSEIAGVSNVEVELDNNRALVEGEKLEDNILKEAIEEAGYDVLGIN